MNWVDGKKRHARIHGIDVEAIISIKNRVEESVKSMNLSNECINKNGIKIRPARFDDAAELLAIYAPYVTGTAITFEYDIPTVPAFLERMKNVMRRYPYLVAERVVSEVTSGSTEQENAESVNALPKTEILGYAYVSAFHPRAAYDWCVETSIYLREDAKGLGLGRQFYACLEYVLAAQNIRNLYACIARPAGEPPKEDAYLTMDSIRFHTHMGYRQIGHFAKCGYKFDKWYDMVWMEKIIDDSAEDPKPVKAFEEIKELFF